MNELDIRNIRLADFDDDFNKTRQSASDVILQEGGRSYRYSDASQKKITSELAEVSNLDRHQPYLLHHESINIHRLRHLYHQLDPQDTSAVTP